MTDAPATPASGAVLIDGRIERATSNALRMVFRDGPGEPLGVAKQGAGDGRGKKLGVLFGFKNGGTGTHELTFANGSVLTVESKDGRPSELTSGGKPFATITRSDTATATLADGTVVARFLPDPDEPKSLELFRLVIADAADHEIGRLDVVRRSTGWSLARTLWRADQVAYWWDHAGAALSIPILGTRVVLNAAPDDALRDVVLGACTDIAIGLRPYVSAMS
ncbi:hypothetical protein [uncultured Jatrophihabitans sp.]|uniref:hypothetical protein n=1 Tax=uncultured Jatrophihabitans sp. TaxID=1610747 RepID=UPI0035CC7003